jgi:hypothetical protein
MNDAERDEALEHVRRWKQVGPMLDAIRRRELRAYDFEKNRALADDLLRMAAAHAKPRRTTGLIRLHRLLREHYS